MVNYRRHTKIFTAILLLVFTNLSLAFTQIGDPQFSQHMNTIMSYNPGYAGSNDQICLTAAARQQYFGLDGAPVTTVFSGNAPFKLFGINSGVGLNVFNDKAGFFNDLGLNISYAYRAKLGDGKLGIGIMGGMLNSALKGEWSVPSGSEYHTPWGQDPAVPGDQSSIIFDMSFGVFYRADKLYMGLSSTHITEPSLNFDKGQPFLKRQYHFTAGYNLQLANPLYEVRPSFYIQSDGSISQITVNTTLVYNKRFWGGVSYRAGDAVIGMIGVEMLNGVRISYSYDYVTSKLGKFTDGSHEFTVGYCFSINKEKAPEKYKSIRYL